MEEKYIIQKKLICREDLALGYGEVVQNRNKASYSLTKVELPLVFDTIAECVANDKLRKVDVTRNRLIQFLGYYEPNDGGGGLFYYDAKDFTSLDDFGVVLVSSDLKRFKRLYAGMVHSEWFGLINSPFDIFKEAFDPAIQPEDNAKYDNTKRIAALLRYPYVLWKQGYYRCIDTITVDIDNNSTIHYGSGSFIIFDYTLNPRVPETYVPPTTGITFKPINSMVSVIKFNGFIFIDYSRRDIANMVVIDSPWGMTVDFKTNTVFLPPTTDTVVSNVSVDIVSDQTIIGNKAFTQPIVVARPTQSNHATTKEYVDAVIGGVGVVDLINSQVIDGAKSFTKPVVSVEPINNNHLTTKKYVDTADAELSNKILENEALTDQLLTALETRLRNSIYPIGATYVQFTDEFGVFQPEHEPANLYQGTQWVKLFNTEDVYFKTEGALDVFNELNPRLDETGVQQPGLPAMMAAYVGVSETFGAYSSGIIQEDIDNNIWDNGYYAPYKNEFKFAKAGAAQRGIYPVSVATPAASDRSLAGTMYIDAKFDLDIFKGEDWWYRIDAQDLTWEPAKIMDENRRYLTVDTRNRLIRVWRRVA